MARSNIDKTCFSKTRYATEEEALDTVAYLYEMEGIRLSVYKCPICNGYHLTKGKK